MRHTTPPVVEMDMSKELESAIKGFTCKELDSMLEGVINDLLGQTSNPPTPPSSPAVPATPPQPVADNPPALLQQALQITASPTTVPAHLCSPPVTGSQGQTFLYHWPVSGIPTAATAPPAAPAAPPIAPAALANPCNILQIPDSMVQYMRPVGVLNGVLVYDFPSTAPSLNTPTPKKRKCQDERQPYIKKPPNAFMLFLKEQRPMVQAEMNINGSAAVNAVVGERWKSMSKQEQAKYYHQADQERMRHAQQHPNWSCQDNYGKKRKRVRSSTCSTVSASKPGPIQPVQAKFFGDTGEKLLSGLENLGPLLPPTQPQEPLSSQSDPCTAPEGSQTSPATPVDSHLSTSVAPSLKPIEPMANDLMSLLRQMDPSFIHADPSATDCFIIEFN